MLERGKNERGVIEMVDTESLVPEGHLLRQVDGALDFERLYEIVEPLYSAEEGRRSIDSVVPFKIVLLQHLDGNASLRGTLRRAETDVAYRWFLGYTLIISCGLSAPFLDRPLFDRLGRPVQAALFHMDFHKPLLTGQTEFDRLCRRPSSAV